MSILDDQEAICNGAEEAKKWDNPLHPGISDETYESLRKVYYPIRNLYQSFFMANCLDDDINVVNSNVLEKLTAKGVFTSPTYGGPFATEEDLESIRRYVITAFYPASYDDMLAFIHRVRSGDLQFLCRYPDSDEITSLDRIIKMELSQNPFSAK